jgi:hypothetical protein
VCLFYLNITLIINHYCTIYNDTTDGGYWSSGSGSGFSNLDGNAETTCGTA